jgi:NADH:ubiquinone oxidoreductase subunit 5 (subunit L)/multisubunit Na+/H+ antiporter MnhA subunit
MQCGLGAFGHAVFHIVAHGVFKGQAFLRSGSAVRPFGARGVAVTPPAWTYFMAPVLFVILLSRGVELPGILLATVLASTLSEVLFSWAAQRPGARAIAQTLVLAGVAAAAFTPMAASGPLGADPAALLPAVVLAVVLTALASLAFIRSRAIALPAFVFAALTRLSGPALADARRPVAATARGRRELAGETA